MIITTQSESSILMYLSTNERAALWSKEVICNNEWSFPDIFTEYWIGLIKKEVGTEKSCLLHSFQFFLVGYVTSTKYTFQCHDNWSLIRLVWEYHRGKYRSQILFCTVFKTKYCREKNKREKIKRIPLLTSLAEVIYRYIWRVEFSKKIPREM